VQTIEQEIRAFVQDSFLIGHNGEVLGSDTSFLERGIIDSTGVLELVAFIEQSYSIKIGDDELVPENLDSIRRVAAFVERKLDTAAMESAA
jgi:acyl carrier protein